jgi:hypothetical protein
MRSLFEPSARQEILGRLDRLQPTNARQWGKMNAPQMMEHCARALEVATGDLPLKHSLIGKILGPLVKKGILGEKPFSRNSPTDPNFVISDEHDFAAEKTRLANVITRFTELGPGSAGAKVHSFFGKLTGDEWGRLMYKHLDHHFTQFSA